MLGRFRARSPQVALHPLEKGTLALVVLHLCFLPWALGTVHLWSQLTSLGLALLGFVVAALPRTYTAAESEPPARIRPLRRLGRFPLFWLGLFVLGYIAVQALNPAWRYRSNAAYWWIEAIDHVRWLPSGMDVPFPIAGPWRALIIHASLWLTLCTVWMGLLRRRSFRLLFTFLAVNGGLLAVLGLVQQLTHAKAVFWTIAVRSTSFVASFIYRNHAGAYLNLVLAVAVGLAWWHHDRARRRLERSSPSVVFLFIAAVLAIAALSTVSRGTALSLLLFLGVAGARFVWTRFHQPAAPRPWAALAALLLLFSGFLAVGLYAIRAQQVWARFEGLLIDPVASAWDRTQAHTAAAEMLAERPVLGWGAGCFRFGFPQYLYRHPDIYYAGIGRRKLWEHAHNDLIEFPLEYGVIGSAALAGSVAWLVWASLRRRGWRNPIAALVLLGAGLTVVHAWADFLFQCPAILLTWAVLLLAATRWSELDTTSAAPERP